MVGDCGSKLTVNAASAHDPAGQKKVESFLTLFSAFIRDSESKVSPGKES